MSTSYGNYLTDDPNRREYTGGTTTPPLTYEGFIGTGTGSNAYQRGVKYAQGVKDSIYGSAETLREQTDIDTENARQRGIIDSQSSYQKAIGAYGSNAETLAGRGLSGSGYGEYLTADAYATHRGQVQDINAGALEANRKAANLEAQTKMEADSEYLKNLYSLGANLDTAKDTAYSSIFDAVTKGTSLDVVKQSGQWGDLTPEQQQAITAEAEKIAADVEKTETLTAIDTMIQNGDSTEDIKGSEEYSKLDDPTKAKVDNILNQRAEHEENTVNYLAGEISGYTSIDDVEKFLGIPDSEGIFLSDDIKEKVIAKWQSANAESVIKNISNASVTENGIVYNDEEYSGIDIANDIKNGVYGDNAQAVVDAYCGFIYNNLDKLLKIRAGASYALSQVYNIGNLASEWKKKIGAAINQKTGYTSSTR